MAPPPDPGIEAYFKKKARPQAPSAGAPDPGIEAYFKQKAQRGAAAPSTREEMIAPIAEPFPLDVAQASAQKVIDYLDSTDVETLRQQFEDAKDAPNYDAAMSLKRAQEKVQAAYQGINDTATALELQAQALAERDPKAADKVRTTAVRLKEALEAHQSGELTPGRLAAKAKGTGLKGLNAVAGVLDLPHKGVRALTGDALDPTRKPDAETMSHEEWIRRMKEQYPAAANIAGATLGLPIAVGAGTLATGLALGMDTLVNLKQRAEGVPEQERQGPSLEGLKDIWKGSWESGKDFGLSMATDPTTPLTLAGGTVKEGVARQVGLLGRASGKSAAEIAQAIEDVNQILKSSSETRVVRGRAAGVEAALSHLEDAGFKGARQAFGANAERFGKNGIGLSAPFTEKRLELSSVVGKVSPKVGLALEAPLTRAGAAIDKALGTQLVDPKATVARTLQQRAIGTRDAATEDFDRRARELLATKAQAAGLNTPKAWDDYVRNTLDPAHTLRALGPDEAIPAGAAIYDVSKGIVGADEPKLVRLLDRVSEGFPEDIRAARASIEKSLEPNQKIMVAEAGPGFVPIQDRPQAVQEFDAAYRSLMDENFDKLRAAGVLSEPAKNLLTGAYVPRQYGRMFDFLEEINVGPSAKMGGANAFKDRTGPLGKGVELGSERVYSGPPPRLTLPGQLRGKLQAETNLANVLPTYDRQAANSIAKESMLRELRSSGMTVKATSAEAMQNPHLYRDIGGGHALPANLYKFVEQVFENKPVNLASIARGLGAEATPAGRAAVKLFETAAKMESQWKRVTLGWRPGYHTLNMVNDTQYLLAMGGTPGDLWRAFNAVKNGKGNQALLKEAQRLGIGASFAGRAEALGVGVEKQKRAFNRLTKGKSDRSGLERAVGAPEQFGDLWSDVARTAGYFARRRLGDSPAKAADAVRRGMIDYGTSTKFLQAMRFFMPFATFQLRGPGAALRHAAASPRTVVGSMRAAQALGGEREPGVEPRQYWADRGQLVPLTDKQKEYAVDKPRYLVGAGPTAENEQAFMLARDAFQDPFTTPALVAAGSGAPAINSLSPWLRMGLEGLGGKNLLVDKPLAPTAAPVNAGVPWWAGALQGGAAGLVAGQSLGAGLTGAAIGGGLAAGDWAEASPTAQINGQPADQVGWLQHYFAGLAPPAVLPALNQLAREGAGPLEGMGQNLGPPTPMSAWRAYDPAGDPKATVAGQAVSTMTGFPVGVANPADTLYNRTNAPGFLEAQAANLRLAELIRKLEAWNARQRMR